MKPVPTHAMPKTIDELRAFCLQKGMPLEQMRFFIGEDCREPRAFGVYQDDDGRFVVYKNKSKGARAVRCRCRSERRAVAEIIRKLGCEIALRREALFPGTCKRPVSAASVLKTVGTGALRVVGGALCVYLFFSGDYYFSPKRSSDTPESTPALVEDREDSDQGDPAPVAMRNWRPSDWKDWDTSLTEWSWDW